MNRIADRRLTLRSCGQRLLAPGADRRLGERLGRALAAVEATAGPALDVGCGAEARLARLVSRPFAIDRSLLAARGAAAAGARSFVACATALPFADRAFALVVSVGLLHHLSDADAARAVAEMRRVTAPAGATVVVDAVLPEPAWRRPLAWLIRALDRGRAMRREEQLARLLPAPAGWSRERFTYAATGLEALSARSRAAS